MGRRIEIEPVTRIEGHGAITVQLDDQGRVSDARFHVTQFRGFEKFCEGRPYYEMPALVERICGICPVSHSLASARACDAILGVRVPRTAQNLRRVLNCAAFIASHALSFFYLSAPDLLLGMDADPARRNLQGLAAADPAVVKNGIALRRTGQGIIETFAGKRIHPAWVVPGGVNAGLTAENRDQILSDLPAAKAIVLDTLADFKGRIAGFQEEIASFANFPSLFVGLVNAEGDLALSDGTLRFVDDQGSILADDVDPADYPQFIGEAAEPFSYLKSPYYTPLGYPDGIYRVGPAARLNVCNNCGTPLADQEMDEFRGLASRPLASSFHNHHARLIEILYCIETIEALMADPEILDPRVRAQAEPNFGEGLGCVEAPRGTLLHHYRVDPDGLITWVNLIVATGHNNLAMNRGVRQVAERFIRGDDIAEGALNRLEAVIRAFDPCLSCSTHALGRMPLEVEVRNPDGSLRRRLRRE
ncbi:MAG: Ni/Fe hydrogenase subunit alpha [Desulfobacteraceae bacterium]|jgi:NAD-reducing hydrogenase large subunit